MEISKQDPSGGGYTTAESEDIMKFRKYIVEYETEEGYGTMEIDADGPASASDACYYEHSDEPGYKEIHVLAA